MQNKSKPIIMDQEAVKRKRRKQLRSWLILIAVILLIIGAVNLISFFSRTTTVSALSLPCYAHQDVTVFQDGVLYYDGASIHFVNAGGGIEWSYPVGDGASFSVSDDHLVIWAGTQLFIVDAKGKPFKFEVSQISTQLIVAFICGVLAPIAGVLFSRKTLPLLLPLVGSVATLMIFLMSPVMQAGQNWIISVIVAGVCAAVSGAGIVIGVISWVKVRGHYFSIPRKVPVAQ